MGCTVGDSSTVMVAYLSHVIQSYAHELPSCEEVQQLLGIPGRDFQKRVTGQVSETLTLGTLLQVCAIYSEKNIPLRDMRTTAEKLAAEAAASQDLGVLAAGVRVALGLFITRDINSLRLKIPLIITDCSLERLLQYTQRAQGTGGMAMEPGFA